MKNKIILFITVLTAITSSYAQEGAIKKAEKQYDKFAYIDATKTYERIAEKGYKSADMFQKLGNAYYFNADLAKAAKWYGELFAMNTEVSPEYYYRYSQALKSIGEYQKADQMMATFNQKVTDDSESDLTTAQNTYSIIPRFVYRQLEIFAPQTSNEIDLSNSPRGIYFVKINDGKKFNTGKITVQ